MCRWTIAGTHVDLMPRDARMLGFTNRWYRVMMEHAITVQIGSGRGVRIVSAPYFVATKLEAHYDRDAGDVLFSRDVGDIVALVDGREELVNEVRSTGGTVRAFIANGFRTLLENPSFLDAIPAHLLPDAASQARTPLIIERMQRVAEASSSSEPDR